MEALRQKALQLGQDSAFGATEVIQAFTELGKAGLSVKDVLAGVGDAVVQLAVAGELPLANAATIVVNTMKQFGIEAKDAVKVADLLTQAANASTLEVSDLAVSLRYAGPVAAGLGVSLEDTIRALALLGDAGIRGSTAGTSLRGVLLGLFAPTKASTAALKMLGIVTDDGGNKLLDAAGNAKPLNEIFGILKESMKGMTAAQQTQILKTIFQRRALAAAKVLIQDSGKAWDEMGQKMRRAGTSQDIMQKKLDNLSGSWDIFKASMETAAIRLGSLFIPILTPIIDFLTRLVNKFIALPDSVILVIGSVLVLGGALLILTGIIGLAMSAGIKSIKVWKDLATAFRLVAGAARLANLSMLANPYVLLAIAILALIAGLVALWIWWDKIWSFIGDGPWYLKAAVAIFLLINPMIQLVVALMWLAKNWETVWEGMQAAVAAAWSFIQNVFHNIVDWLSNIPQHLKDLPDILLSALGNLGSLLLEKIPELLDAAFEMGQQLGEKFFELGNAAAEKLKEGLSALGSAIVEEIGNLPGQLIGAGQALFNWALDNGPLIIKGLILGAQGFIPLLIQFFLSLPGYLMESMPAIFTWIQENGVTIMKYLALGLLLGVSTVLIFFLGLPLLIAAILASIAVGFIVEGAKWMWGLLQGLLDNWPIVLGWFTGIPFEIFGALAGLAGMLLGIGWGALTAMASGVASGFGAVIGFVAGIPGAIVGALASLAGLLLGIGQQAISSLANAISSGVGAVISAVAGIPAAAVGALSGLVSAFAEIASTAVQAAANAITNGIGKIASAAKDLASNVVSTLTGGLLGSPWFFTRDVGQDLLRDLMRGLERSWPTLDTLLKQRASAIQSAMNPSAGLRLAAAAGGVRAAGTGAEGGTSSTSTREGDFVYQNYGSDVSAGDIVDEWAWNKRFGRAS